jgi:hypothetical protein
MFAAAAAVCTPRREATTPTTAVVRISFSFIVAPLDLSPWRFVVYHSERAGSRRRRFSSDIAYSERPAASRASSGSANDFR